MNGYPGPSLLAHSFSVVEVTGLTLALPGSKDGGVQLPGRLLNHHRRASLCTAWNAAAGREVHQTHKSQDTAHLMIREEASWDPVTPRPAQSSAHGTGAQRTRLGGCGPHDLVALQHWGQEEGARGAQVFDGRLKLRHPLQQPAANRELRVGMHAASRSQCRFCGAAWLRGQGTAVRPLL
jgi:hypothetical protein